MEAEQILIRPLLTEKSNQLQSGSSTGGYKKYSFQVDPRANKHQVMGAVRELFRAEVIACNIVTVKSKKKRNLPISKTSVKRGYGKRSPWKKAIVSLAKGQSIEALETVGVDGTT